MSDLMELLRGVAASRKYAREVAAELTRAEAILNALPEAEVVAALRGLKRNAEAEAARFEMITKQEALAEYEYAGDKHPADGVEIKEFAAVQYDSAIATNWCRANAQNLLVLDAKRFERAVKGGALDVPPEVAQVAPEMRAQLASDLSEYEEE